MSYLSERARLARERQIEAERWRAFGTSAAPYHRKAANDFLSSKFSNDPTDQERSEWSESHARLADAIESGDDPREALEMLFLCDARWFVVERKITPALPGDQEWARQIVSYANVMARSRANREARAKGMSEGATPPPPTTDEHAMARNLSGAFERWYRPIENHQVRAHRCFLNLALTGNAAHVELMRSVFRRADDVSTQLGRRLHGSSATIAWVPDFKLSTQGEPWAAMFPRQGNWSFRDVTEWWGVFAASANRFYPKQPRLPLSSIEVGYGLDDTDQDGLF